MLKDSIIGFLMIVLVVAIFFNLPSYGHAFTIARDAARTTLAAYPSEIANNVNSASPQNQTSTTRDIIVEWMETQSGQDRFYPDFIVVNQGDTVNLTFINNDTVAHDFVIGAPYNIMLNATVPGLYDDMTGQEFTTSPTNNSPGVQVSGTPGNVSATYSFVAKYAGIFEYVCSYHIPVGMIGYLVVLYNSSSSNPGLTQANTTSQTLLENSSIVQVSIDAGSGTNVNLPGYTPVDLTVVIGINNTVKWTNNDNMAHTVTAIDGSFDSGNMNADESFLHTFSKTGTYAYLCLYHHWMQGRVTVIPGVNNTQILGLSIENETYGLIAIGIVILVVILVAFSRRGRTEIGES